ncbi:MAG: hypothetical protein V1847_02550 [Candidatus Diapherotrites archaeon]
MLDIFNNIWIALTIFALVWIFSWAKSNMGSAKIALIFAIVIVWLTFYSYPDLIWIGVFLFLLATFGKEVIEKSGLLDKK